MRFLVSSAVSLVMALTIVTESPAWVVSSFVLPEMSVQGVATPLPGGDILALTGAGVTFVARLDAATGARRWFVPLASGDFLRAVVVHPGGDAIVAGGAGSDALLVSFDAATGAQRWRVTVPLPAVSVAAVAGGGDVVAAGSSGPSVTNNAGVARFDAVTGAVRWQASPGLNVNALAVDGMGHVLVAGWVEYAFPFGTEATVVKLDGATGAELWRVVEPGIRQSAIGALGVDAANDVFIAGSRYDVSLDRRVTLIAKLAADDGTELWRSPSEGGGAGYIVVDAAGDVYHTAASTAASDVVKRSGATGAELWRITPPGLSFRVTAYDAAHILASDTSFVSLVRQESGDIVWSHSLTDPIHTIARAGGDAVMTAGYDIFALIGNVTRIAPELGGKQLRIIDRFADPAARSFRVRSGDALIAPAATGGPSAPTNSGAVLELRNPTTGETASMSLPASNWSARVSARPGVKIYSYRDSHRAVGPCTKATLETGRKLDIRCSGAGVGFTLDEPAQGALAVKLTTGSFSQCLLFDAASVKHDAAATATTKGFFKAQDSAAPASCP